MENWLSPHTLTRIFGIFLFLYWSFLTGLSGVFFLVCWIYQFLEEIFKPEPEFSCKTFRVFVTFMQSFINFSSRFWDRLDKGLKSAMSSMLFLWLTSQEERGCDVYSCTVAYLVYTHQQIMDQDLITLVCELQMVCFTWALNSRSVPPSNSEPHDTCESAAACHN